MTKKVVLVLLVAALVAGSAFAQREFIISLGAGGYFTSDFGGGIEMNVPGFSMSAKTPYYGGGGFVFLDATFAELSFGSVSGFGTMDANIPGLGSGSADMSYTGLDIGLLLKYPFDAGDKLQVFPLLGITYRFMISVKEDGKKIEDPSSGIKSRDFSALWFKGGGGLDFALSDSLFLRAELLYGIRLKNTFEKDMIDSSYGIAEARLGHGLDVKLAIGYRF
jgi:outer membrane protein W